jgi:hypothetical protein
MALCVQIRSVDAIIGQVVGKTYQPAEESSVEINRQKSNVLSFK